MKQIDDAISYFNWLILDEFQDIKCWIAGGAVRDYFSYGKPKSDIDIFFPNQEEFDKADSKLFSNIENKLLKSSENAKLFKHKHGLIHIIQKHFYETPNDIINSFDFTVCCAAIGKDCGLIYHETFFIDLARRKLVINSLPFPLSSLQRLQKYIKKGFWICNGGLLELSKALKNIDFEDKNQNILEFYPDGTPKFNRID